MNFPFAAWRQPCIYDLNSLFTSSSPREVWYEYRDEKRSGRKYRVSFILHCMVLCNKSITRLLKGLITVTSVLFDRKTTNWKARLRAVSLFSWSVKQNARDKQMTTRVTVGARRESHYLVSRVSRFRRSTLARACTPLTKSEEKERLLAVYWKALTARKCFVHYTLSPLRSILVWFALYNSVY